MTATPKRAISFVKTVVSGIKTENVPFMAASIAYQAFVSLIPLLVLVFFLVSVVGDEGLASTVADTTEGVLPDSGTVLLEEAIAGSVATAGGTAIGLITLLWGSLKIFRGLDTAFSEIYDSAGENSFVEQLRDALVVLVAIGLALVAAAIATTVFAFAPESALLGVVNPLLLVGAFSVAFVPMYYFFPDVDLTVRDVLPGVLVAAVGWAALQALFQVYASFSAESDAAGGFGAIMLLLTWLYFGGMMLLIGGVVNAAYSGHLEVADDEDAATDEESASDEGVAAGTDDRDSIDHSPSDLDETNLDRDDLESIIHRERDRSRRRIRGIQEDRRREIRNVQEDRAVLERELIAERSQRQRLDARIDSLEATIDGLTGENERLRQQLDRQRTPRWKRTLHDFFDRVSEVNVLVVRR